MACYFKLDRQVISGSRLHNALASYVAKESLFNFIIIRHRNLRRYSIGVEISTCVGISKFQNKTFQRASESRSFKTKRFKFQNVAMATHVEIPTLTHCRRKVQWRNQMKLRKEAMMQLRSKTPMQNINEYYYRSAC